LGKVRKTTFGKSELKRREFQLVKTWGRTPGDGFEGGGERGREGWRSSREPPVAESISEEDL